MDKNDEPKFVLPIGDKVLYQEFDGVYRLSHVEGITDDGQYVLSFGDTQHQTTKLCSPLRVIVVETE